VKGNKRLIFGRLHFLHPNDHMNSTSYCSSIYRQGTQPKLVYNCVLSVYKFAIIQMLRINKSLYSGFGLSCNLRNQLKPKLWYLSKPCRISCVPCFVVLTSAFGTATLSVR
jgi:hypothetical protein